MANELSRQEADDFAREIADVFWPNGTTKAQDAIYDNQIEALIPLLQRTVHIKCAEARLEEAKRGIHEYDAYYPHQTMNPIGRCQQCERIATLEKEAAKERNYIIPKNNA